jgi:hypothetical protein
MSPQPNSGVKSFLCVWGALEAGCSDITARSREFIEKTRRVEEVVRKSFHPLQVEGVQHEVAKPERDSQNWYDAVIDVTDGGRIAEVRMQVEQGGHKLLSPRFSTDVTLPMGDYASKSRQALTGIWQMINVLGFRMQEIPEGADERDFENCSILLTQAGARVASGHPALLKADLYLSRRPVQMFY